MNRAELNPEAMLDSAVAEVLDETVDSRVVEEARQRVWARIVAEAGAASSRPERLETCDDFRALFDEYRAGKLMPAQRMLVEDHTHECVACRKALYPITVRLTDTNVVEMPKRTWRPMRWAAAAAIFVTAGITSFWLSDMILPPPPGDRMTVLAANGAVYRLKDGALQPVAAGAVFTDRERLRTAGGAHAMLRLLDGSTVEVAERAELSVAVSRKDTNLFLDRGQIIVQAAKRKRGNLFVNSPDSRVAVTGTVFSVNRGLKGSRVSVIEGSVDVRYRGRQDTLRPGDQVATDRSIASVPITDEISWSQNYEQHLALLRQFVDLKAKLDKVSIAGLRYGTRLLDAVPEGTTVFVSVPNLSRALNDVQRILNEQAAQSPELRQMMGKEMAHADQAISQITQIGEYLGDEIAVAFQPCKGFCGVLVAEVHKPGLKEYIEKQFAEEAKHLRIEFVNNRIIVGEQAEFVAAAMRGNSSFAQSPLGVTVQNAFKRGTGILVAADLEKMVAREAAGASSPGVFSNLGIDRVRHLVAEQRDINGKTEYSAVVSFDGARSGMASWIAAPGSMGGLGFVSPNAQAAASFVVKEPAQMLRDIASLTTKMSNPGQQFDEFEHASGIRLDELAAALGGEVTLALDGPMIPIPSWKLILEVKDEARVQEAITKLVTAANSKLREHGKPAIELTTEPVPGGGTAKHYTLRLPETNLAEVHYTYLDGYAVFAASDAVLQRALNDRRSGVSLARSREFRNLLPGDTRSNVSGVIYQNAGDLIRLMAQGAGAVAGDTERQKAAEEIAQKVEPMLVAIYGGTDRIEIASQGSALNLLTQSVAGHLLSPALRNRQGAPIARTKRDLHAYR